LLRDLKFYRFAYACAPGGFAAEAIDSQFDEELEMVAELIGHGVSGMRSSARPPVTRSTRSG
jgi:hypothetical protein